MSLLSGKLVKAEINFPIPAHTGGVPIAARPLPCEGEAT